MALAVMAACGGQGETPRAALPDGFAFGIAAGALAVSRPAAPLSYSQGLTAKRAASAFCAAQGGRLNPAAFGRFDATVWHFAGGCV